MPNNITAGGNLVRKPGQERIAYLAAVRNTLITPFYDTCMHGSATRDEARIDQAAEQGGETDMTADNTTWLGLRPLKQAACFRPEKFLFINDVYFCPVGS